MGNYKKSLMSVATILALSSASLLAEYIPLTGNVATTDEKWVLFGVTGLKSDGANSGGAAGVFSITDSQANTVTDTMVAEDELFTEGFVSVGGNLGKVKAIGVSKVQVRIDTTDLTYNETEPVHTMYIRTSDSGTPDFVVTYKAAMEGQEMQYSTETDGSNVHSIILSSSGTYRDPGQGTIIGDESADLGTILSKIKDAVDYNLTNNPPLSAYYDKGDHQNRAATDEYIRVYSYDAINTRWDLYDSRNTDDVNDFDELVKGKAYWGKMNVETTDRQGGIVLSSSSITSDEYLTAGLTSGWNLIAFANDDGETIRKSSTGLILTLDGADNIEIWDSSANHSVTVAVDQTDAAAIITSCFTINQAIKDAKINGMMPKTFDLKAFPKSATEIVLISNTRFMVAEAGAGAVAGVTTLTGAAPYALADKTDITQTDDSAATADLDDTAVGSVMSKYGEYAIVVEPLVGAGTAETDTGITANINLQSLHSDDFDAAALAAPVAISTDVAFAATNISGAIGGATYVATAIDTDYDAALAVDKILIASEKPFYIRDHVFTRVFDYTTDGNETIAHVRGAGTDADITLVGAADADAAALALAGADGVEAVALTPTTGPIVIVSSAVDKSKFDVTEDIDVVDKLTDAQTSNDVAKGAIKGVYSLDSLAATPIVYSMNFQVVAPDAADDNVTVSLKSSYGTTVVGTKYTVSSVPPINWANEVKTLIEEELTAAKMTGTVVVETNASITLTSTEVMDIAFTREGGEADIALGTATVVAGNLEEITPDLASDLKFNPVFAPNYVSAGPLYTMMNAGFELKAMVSGSTDLSGTATQATVSWESIDLTRKPSEWLSEQDYSLFSTDDTAGYWAYLETGTEETLSISKIIFKPAYTNHFNKNGTTYNNVVAQLAVTVEGLPQVGDDNYDDSAIVRALVNGERIELIKPLDTSNVFNGEISSYELEALLVGKDYPLYITLANGQGSNLLNEDSGEIIDLTKPAKPTIDLGDGVSVDFASTSEDVAGFYVFDGVIPDYQTSDAGNLLEKLTPDEATGFALCGADSIVKLSTYDADAYNLKVIAVDGTGSLEAGNASDVASVTFIPMLKSAIRLTDTNDNDSDPAQFGTMYGADCTEAGAQEIDYGMSITAESDEERFTIAYEPRNGSDTAVPITIYIKNLTSIGEITYSDIYVGDVIYLELNNQVFSYELPATPNAVDTAYDITAVGMLRPNQDLWID